MHFVGRHQCNYNVSQYICRKHFCSPSSCLRFAAPFEPYIYTHTYRCSYICSLSLANIISTAGFIVFNGSFSLIVPCVWSTRRWRVYTLEWSSVSCIRWKEYAIQKTELILIQNREEEEEKKMNMHEKRTAKRDKKKQQHTTTQRTHWHTYTCTWTKTTVPIL